MKKGFIWCFVLASTIGISGVAAMAQDASVPLYPGARSDGETKAVCAEEPPRSIIQEREESAGLTKSKQCYRTSDPFAKVVAFYRNQEGFKGDVNVDEQEAKTASFCRGICNEVSVGTSIAISTPWFVPGAMKMNNDLLIFITTRRK